MSTSIENNEQQCRYNKPREESRTYDMGNVSTASSQLPAPGSPSLASFADGGDGTTLVEENENVTEKESRDPLPTSEDHWEAKTVMPLDDRDVARDEALQGIWIPNGLKITCNGQSGPYLGRYMNENGKGTFNLTPMERFLAGAGPWNALGLQIDSGNADSRAGG